MNRANGQALATLLILLVAFALLALSAMATALAGLATAGQEAESALAQEAAEAAIAGVLRSWPATRVGRDPAPAWTDLPPDITAAAAVLTDPPDAAAPWASGVSLGDDGEGLVQRHYSVVATGRARRGAMVTLEQGFTVMEPAR
jgi:type II secretory pathway pseudopilin PulG